MLDPLFNGTSDIDQLTKLCAVLGTPPKSWDQGYSLAKQGGINFPSSSPLSLDSLISTASPEALDLLAQLLQWDPSRRITPQAALSHPFFSKAAGSVQLSPENFTHSTSSAKLGKQKLNAISKPLKEPTPKLNDSEDDLWDMNEYKPSKDVSPPKAEVSKKKQIEFNPYSKKFIEDDFEDLDAFDSSGSHGNNKPSIKKPIKYEPSYNKTNIFGLGDKEENFSSNFKPGNKANQHAKKESPPKKPSQPELFQSSMTDWGDF